MKYEITNERTDTFKPFKVIIEIETEEEYIFFHDVVAGKLIKDAGMHQFMADVYNAGHNQFDGTVSGKF